AAAGLLFTAPYIPMLFMGEEYAEENPFLFFTDYQDPELKKAVVEGRREEFAAFGWGDIPNPEEDSTFFTSRLTPRERWRPHQEQIFNYYRDLIYLRREHPVLKVPDKTGTTVKVDPESRLVKITRRSHGRMVTALANLGPITLTVPHLPGTEIFNSEKQRYGGRENMVKETGSTVTVKAKPGVTVNERPLLPGQFLIFES
ncbi:MAG: DUF3459 domain-containing protein, partial [Firmicutes bacterium]|nr:DUF3459 domain-containing protein [Bacillota bacterium]